MRRRLLVLLLAFAAGLPAVELPDLTLARIDASQVPGWLAFSWQDEQGREDELLVPMTAVVAVRFDRGQRHACTIDFVFRDGSTASATFDETTRSDAGDALAAIRRAAQRGVGD